MLKDSKEAPGTQSQILNHDIFHSFGGQTMTNFQHAADGTPVSQDGLSPSNPPLITEKISSFVPTTDTKNVVRTFYYGLNSNLGPGSSMSNFNGDSSPTHNKESSGVGDFQSFVMGRSRLMHIQAVQSDSTTQFGDNFPGTSTALKKQSYSIVQQGQQPSEYRLKNSLDRENQRMKLAGKTSNAFN